MSAAYHNTFTLPAALDLLPPRFDTPEARALLLAIALQESRFRHRRQVGNGPARSFWQFELAGGVVGVLTHHATRPFLEPVLEQLCYVPAASACFDALEHNDVLGAVFARLLLFTLPGALPKRGEAERGWQQYLAAWRPGHPRRETWDSFFASAWALVDPAGTV